MHLHKQAILTNISLYQSLLARLHKFANNLFEELYLGDYSIVLGK